MLKILIAFKTELQRTFWVLKSYKFDLVVGNIVTYIMFLALFYGIKMFASSNLQGESLDSLVIGYVVWGFASSSLVNIPSVITSETAIGTLEQLYLSPLGIVVNLLSKMLSTLLISTVTAIILLILTMLTTNRWFDLISLLKVYPMLLLSVPSLWGCGLLLGGLVLNVKQMSSVQNILIFVLIYIISIPATPFSVYSYLPFATGSYLIRKIAVNKELLAISEYLFVAANSLFYFLVGLGGYKLLEKQAKLKNLLGQY